MRVILRDQHDEQGTRHLSASIDDRGDFVVEGQDLGDDVEAIFGAREYEWSRRVRAASVPALCRAFGAHDPAALLDVIATRFTGDGASQLDAAIDAANVPVEKWSRVGD